MKQLPIYALFALLISSLVFWGIVLSDKKTTPKALGKKSIASVSVILPPDRTTLLFAGDIMLDRGVEYQIKQNGGNWNWPFLLIKDFLSEADLVFGNLESQISDKGERMGSIYSFRADPKSLEGLTYAGFNVLSVANNHSFDYGVQAFKDSLKRLDDTGIATVGGGLNKKEAHTPTFKHYHTSKYDSTTIGILAYTAVGSPNWQATSNIPGISWVDPFNIDEVLAEIEQGAAQTDLLVVSIHAGEEYKTEPNSFQQAFARSAIDSGADLVIGHHPHVVQPVERYKEGWIAYSLGNFIFDQGFSAETMQGLLLKVEIEDSLIYSVTSIPTRLTKDFQVFIP